MLTPMVVLCLQRMTLVGPVNIYVLLGQIVRSLTLSSPVKICFSAVKSTEFRLRRSCENLFFGGQIDRNFTSDVPVKICFVGRPGG